jgi:hypothetical protein
MDEYTWSWKVHFYQDLKMKVRYQVSIDIVAIIIRAKWGVY